MPTCTFVVDAGLTWTVSGVVLSVHGDWRYRYKFGKIRTNHEGSFDLDASGITVRLSVTVGWDKTTGHPTIVSAGCSSSVGNLSIRLQGVASWFYDFFVRFVEKPIGNDLETSICDAARRAIDKNAREELATLGISTAVGRNWLLDYRLVAPPRYAAGELETYHKGEFFYNTDLSEAPFYAPRFPPPPAVDRMLSIVISEYVANTGLYVLFNHGFLTYELTKTNLADTDKTFLDTECSGTCFGRLIPNLRRKYPAASVEMEMTISQAPTLEIHPSGIFGHFLMTVVCYARSTADNIPHYIGTISLAVKVALDVVLDGTAVKAQVVSLSLTSPITIDDSTIGTLSSRSLNNAFDLLKTFIIKKLNDFTDKGVQLLDLEGVEFVDSKLELGERCIYVSTDVRYQPKPL